MSKTAEQVAEHTFFKETRSAYDSIPCLIVSALRSAGWLREANEIPALAALEGYKSALCAADKDIVRLTRERDEARRELAGTKEDAAQWHRNYIGMVEERDGAFASRDSWNAAACQRSEEANELRHELATARRERDEAQNTIYALRGVIHDMENERAALRATQSSPEVLAVVEAAKAWCEWWKEERPHEGGALCRALAAAVDALAAVERKAEPKPRWTPDVWAVFGPDGLAATWDRCTQFDTPETCARKYAYGRGEGFRAVRLVESDAADAAGRKS